MGNKGLIRVKRDFFAYLAFWQFVSFILLLCLIWYSELRDVPAALSLAEPTPFCAARACILSAAVIFTAIIAVGHTYVQQRKVISSLFLICSACGKVRVNSTQWDEMDNYLTKQYNIAFSHGYCPDCYGRLSESGDLAKPSSDDA